jgi:hypothetical protein
MVTSVGGRAAHHCLKWFEAVVLSRPPVGSVLQPVVKCDGMSLGRGMLGRSVPSCWTLVFGLCWVPAPLPQVIWGGVMSRNSVAAGVVRQTGSTPLAASASVLLTMSTC